MRAYVRFLGTLVCGLGITLFALAQAPPGKHRPAVAAIVKLSDQLDKPDVAALAKKIVTTHDSCEISHVFQIGKRGGAGIGSAAKAGHHDSIAHLVNDWAGAKPPTRLELETHQDDLLRVARVLQAMAELAPFRGDLLPMSAKSKEQVAEEWRKVTAEFKTVTRELRDAIDAIDPSATRKAAVRLQKTCTACHLVVGI